MGSKNNHLERREQGSNGKDVAHGVGEIARVRLCPAFNTGRFSIATTPQYPGALAPGPLWIPTKIHVCSSSLCKMVQYLHITYVHPPIYFKSSLDYL